MCDFREIKSIKLNGTDTVIPIKEIKHATVSRGISSPAIPYMNDIKDPGFYHISASGAYYAYYTGSKWLHEDHDYKVIDFVEDGFKCIDFV